MSAVDKTASLHAIINAYAQALDAIDPETGEVSDEIGATLDALAPALELKLEALAGARARLLADAEASDQLAKRYHARSVAIGKSVERLEGYTLACLQLAGRDRVKAPTASVWIASSQRVAVEVPAHRLPERFQRHVPAKVEADKRALKEALEGGESIEGAKLVSEDGVRFR